MKKIYKTLLTTVALLGGLSASFANNLYTRDNYDAAKKQAEVTYESDNKVCYSFKDNARDVCDAKAKARRIHNLAYAKAHYKNTFKATKNALIDIADGYYKVDIEICDDQQGNPKDVCLKEAKAKHISAIADAKSGKKQADAIQEATEDKVDAQYEVEKEKCDALKDGAKNDCENRVRSQFNK